MVMIMLVALSSGVGVVAELVAAKLWNLFKFGNRYGRSLCVCN